MRRPFIAITATAALTLTAGAWFAASAPAVSPRAISPGTSCVTRAALSCASTTSSTFM